MKHVKLKFAAAVLALVPSAASASDKNWYYLHYFDNRCALSVAGGYFYVYIPCSAGVFGH